MHKSNLNRQRHGKKKGKYQKTHNSTQNTHRKLKTEHNTNKLEMISGAPVG